MNESKFFIISIILFSIFYSSYAFSENDYKTIYEKGEQFFSNKDFSNAFSCFNKVCTEANDPLACAIVAWSFFDGLGVNKNIPKAYSILNELANSQNEYARAQAAPLLEYIFLQNNDDLNYAIKIYSDLQNSTDESIATDAQEALQRIPIYQFMADHFMLLSAIRNNKIKGDQFYTIGLQNNQQLTNLTPDLQQLYIDYISVCSQNYKNKENIIWDIAKAAGDTFINTMIGGFVGFGQSVIDAFKQDKETKEIANTCTANRNAFLDRLTEYGVSARWITFQINSITSN